MGRRFILLDRDGTLIEDRNYLSDPEGVILLPGVAEGLRRLRALGCGLIVITNQSGVGRGLFSVADVERVHHRLRELLRREGVELDGIFFCPHAPTAQCLCRKPQPLLAEMAARHHNFSLREAVVMGDKDSDIELGQRIGARTILVRTGYGRKVEAESALHPDAIVDDLSEAACCVARWIQQDKGSCGP